jgi:hypothetical protein
MADLICKYVRIFAFAHFRMDFLQHWWRHSLARINLQSWLDLYVCACVCTLCMYMHAHALMCAFTHFWTNSLQTWWNIRRVIGSCMCYLNFTYTHAYARYVHHIVCARKSVHGCVLTFWNGFVPNLVETFYELREVAWATWVVALSTDERWATCMYAFLQLWMDSLQTWWTRW